jgi:hypothetical protein
VEVHKTHDHANYHKSAEIGQMLIVYEDEYAMEEAEAERNYRVEGFPSYYHSGLTPPMRRVVQRRFLSRFEERDTRPCPPPPDDVSIVEEEILRLMSKPSSVAKAGKPKGSRGGGGGETPSSSTTTKFKVIEEVEEEIVDYEPWMGEGGGVFTIEDAKMHPEWWLTRAEIREIEAKKLSALEKNRLEQQQRQEQEQQQQQQQQHQHSASSSDVGGGEAGGKGRTSIGKDVSSFEKKTKSDAKSGTAVGGTGKGRGAGETKKKADKEGKKRNKKKQEMLDEVTAAAMTITEGIPEDEDFIDFDDMFDFDNEDITDLL